MTDVSRRQHENNGNFFQKLGLATAPVLFATTQHPELEAMIARRFQKTGDVEAAFEAVHNSDGLERTRELAAKHCSEAALSIESLKDSDFKMLC
jgi:decaprenyl-diphosphate synthase subunit 1